MKTYKKAKKYKQISIYETTKKMLDELKEIYREQNPQFMHVPISYDKIVYELCMFWKGEK